MNYERTERIVLMFESIKYLKERIGPEGKLEVVFTDRPWIAGFRWNPPLGDIIGELITDLHVTLPKDYIVFLSEFANGCRLYYDLEYGQWGYDICSLQQITDMQRVWREVLDTQWRDGFVAFAEMRGEANVLLFDTNQPSRDGTSYAILQSNPIYTVDEWSKPSRSFHEWLDHLITAQGDKYWEWY
jgi:hypothetical protein